MGFDDIFKSFDEITEEIVKNRLDPNKIFLVPAGELKEGDLLIYYKRDFQGPQSTFPVTSVIRRGSWVYVTTTHDEKVLPEGMAGAWHSFNDPVEVYKK